MFKLRLNFFKLMLASCILLTGCIAFSQLAFSKAVPSAMVTGVKSKPELARTILSETGIAKKYDLYLGNSLDMAISPGLAKNTKFMAWMQTLVEQQAGWKYVESKYVDQLEANFSEAELKELLNLAKQPSLKKLLQVEMQAYLNTAEARRELLFKLWDDYNSGTFNPPPGVLP